MTFMVSKSCEEMPASRIARPAILEFKIDRRAAGESEPHETHDRRNDHRAENEFTKAAALKSREEQSTNGAKAIHHAQ